MSFAFPIMLVGGAIALFSIIGYIPGFWQLSNQMTSYIVEFLAIFGDRKPLQGMITLGLTVSIVGILLDMLNFYRYQSVRDRDLS